MNAGMAKATLPEICELVTDGTHDSPKLQLSGVPFIKGKHISSGRIDFSNCDYISEEDHQKCIRRVEPQKNDVLFSNIGSVGDAARVTDDAEFSIKNVALFRPNPNRVDAIYFYYLVVSPFFRGHFLNVRSGSAQPFISLENFRSLRFPYLADRHVQERIGQILCTYDDLIENNRRRIELLEEAARLLYEEWFVRLRFPGHEHVKTVNGLPGAWERKPLGKIAKLNYGKGLKADGRIPGPFPVYGSSGVVGTHNEALVQGPGIIVGRKGNVGSVWWSDCDFFPIDTVYFIDSACSSLHLYHALSRTQFISTDVAVPGLNRDLAHSREILVPEGKVLSLFEETVAPVHQQISKLQKYSESL
jgi:type I restriction enzyme, S subunit